MEGAQGDLTERLHQRTRKHIGEVGGSQNEEKCTEVDGIRQRDEKGAEEHAGHQAAGE